MIAYLVPLLILVGIYVILAVSLDIAVGHTGLMNLGHIAFFGIGAYTSALLTTSGPYCFYGDICIANAGVPFWMAIVIAGCVSSVFGYFLTKAVHKLKGDYLALATLGFNFVIYSLLINWKSLTRGPLGIPGIPKPSLFGFVFSSNYAYFGLVFVVAVLSVYIMYRITISPFGRLLHASRDDELGLRVLGKDTATLKVKAMMISAFFAGVAGSLYAHYITFIDPTSFTLPEVIIVLTIVIVGGIASIKGNIVSAFIIVLIPELLRFMSLPSSIMGPMRQIVYALILLGILLFRPRGLFGRVDLV